MSTRKARSTPQPQGTGQQSLAVSAPHAAGTPPAAPPPKFRDRITALKRVKASELVPNSKNWRRHPDEQVGAMTATLQRMGIVDAQIVREIPGGKYELLDGHMRKDIYGDQLVPVIVVDLNDSEAQQMLATFDPLGDLALMDADALRTLLTDIDIDEDAFMRKMMSDVENELATEVQTTGAKAKEVDGMALEAHEHYDYLVVFAQTSHEWNVLCDRLGLKPEKRRAKIGTARAIRATRLLEKLNAVN